MAWTKSQTLMLEKLNALVVGGEWENATVKDIAIKHARDPDAAPIFNYASMAHNNHFFFQCLSPVSVPMRKELERELMASFGSIETLRQEFIVTANAMFGPGFVWLVKEQPAKYSILCTYLAGSPYPGAHYRRQATDMNTVDSNIPEAVARAARQSPVNTVGSHGQLSQRHQIAPGGTDLIPVLCLNTWEHVYLRDYELGVFGKGGKREFVERWWDCIDWNVVADNANIRADNPKMRG
jgi:Fe-Mn family superoxide dismutase